MSINAFEKEKVVGSGGVKEISLGEGFGDVALKVNGAMVEVHADGSAAAYTNRSVDVYTNGPVQVHPAANDDQFTARESVQPQIGDKMPDGHKQAGWILRRDL